MSLDNERDVEILKVHDRIDNIEKLIRLFILGIIIVSLVEWIKRDEA